MGCGSATDFANLVRSASAAAASGTTSWMANPVRRRRTLTRPPRQSASWLAILWASGSDKAAIGSRS